MLIFKPKNFIKVTEKTQNNECVICNFITDKPLTCNGQCGQRFCSQCVNCIRNNRNECPFRCSKPFELTEGNSLDLEFVCPFDGSNCKEPILSVAAFNGHSDFCKFVPEDWKQRQDYFQNYKCDKGHDLFYMNNQVCSQLFGFDYYNKLQSIACCSCQQKFLSRTICPTCSTKQSPALYCPNCRKPPCTKHTCPFDHALSKGQTYYRRSLLCDFCGSAAHLLGPNCYEDRACNFDICEACYITLPEEHPLVPFKTPKSVLNHLMPEEQPRHFKLFRRVVQPSSPRMLNLGEEQSSQTNEQIQDLRFREVQRRLAEIRIARDRLQSLRANRLLRRQSQHQSPNTREAQENNEQ